MHTVMEERDTAYDHPKRHTKARKEDPKGVLNLRHKGKRTQ